MHDLTTDGISYGLRPSTSIQLHQINAITAYNKALPKRYKKNGTIPMISSSNVGTISVIRKDRKKGTVELV